MRSSESGHRALVAFHAYRGPGRRAWFVRRMSTPQSTLSSSQIRKRGLKFLGVGSGLFALVLFLLFWLSAHAHSINFPIVGASFPLALALIGSVELITGLPFRRLANSWMRLRGWQRGVLGTLIVLTSLAVIICLVTFFVMTFTRFIRQIVNAGRRSGFIEKPQVVLYCRPRVSPP